MFTDTKAVIYHMPNQVNVYRDKDQYLTLDEPSKCLRRKDQYLPVTEPSECLQTQRPVFTFCRTK